MEKLNLSLFLHTKAERDIYHLSKLKKAWLRALLSKFVDTFLDNNIFRHPRNAELNTIIQTALESVIIPSKKELPGLFHEDGKRVDGMTLWFRSRGQMLLCDATSSDTLAPSYLHLSSSKSGLGSKYHTEEI